MSSVGSPPSSPNAATSHASTVALAEAAERRMRQHTPTQTAAQLAAEHEKRQNFRRMIDPGIMRPNAYEVAMTALKTLLTLSDNLIKDPSNPKFQQFKPTNSTIKTRLVDPKGTLEYAIAMGFRSKIQDFQPLYVFNPRKMDDLQIGNQCIKEFVDLETAKQERNAASRAGEKAAKEAAAEQVRLAYFDDRKSKELHNQREREAREARARLTAQRIAAQEAAPTEPELEAPSTRKGSRMPGVGHTLNNTEPRATEIDGDDDDEEDDED